MQAVEESLTRLAALLGLAPPGVALAARLDAGNLPSTAAIDVQYQAAAIDFPILMAEEFLV